MAQVGFLEDQSQAIYTWRSAFDAGETFSLVGMKGYMHLLDGSMQILRSTKTWDSMSNLVRVVGVSDNTNVFLASSCGGCGFISANPNSFSHAEISRFGNPYDPKSALTVDADIHGSGSMAALLSLSSISLVDPQREAVTGHLPMGATGTPNCMRIADANSIVAGSMVGCVYDVRSHKKGLPASVLTTPPEFSGRCFTSIEADGNHNIVAGDSAGGMWLWDIRKPTESLKSVHAHSGAVLSIALNDGLVASSGTDGSVSLWSLVESDTHAKKKHKRLVVLEPDNTIAASLKRMAVEGSGAALSVSIEDSVGSDTRTRHVSYVTDTGLAVLTPISAFYQ